MMDGSRLVIKIDTYLKQRNIKRLALADYCGINVQSFADWTRRGTLPNAEVAIKIAQFLGVSIEWLFDDDYENSWLKYDDDINTHGISLSPKGILRRIEKIIRDRLPDELKNNSYELNEVFFVSILDTITFEQINACYENRYEPSLIQLYTISNHLNISLEWLLTGRSTKDNNLQNEHLTSVQKDSINFQKYFNSLPKSDQTQITDFVMHLFHSRRKIREALIERKVDIKNIPELLQ